MQPKLTELPQNSNGENKEYHDHLRAIQNSIFSIGGDLFKDIRWEGSKSIKFLEKMLKVLEMKMQNIAMGIGQGCCVCVLIAVHVVLPEIHPYSCSDQHIHQTITIFYGSSKMSPSKGK